LPYLEGELPPGEAARVEKHLRDCEDCRVKFFRLRVGHQSARELRRLESAGPLPEPKFEDLMADLGRTPSGRRRRWIHAWENWLYARTTPRLVQGLFVLALVLAALLAISNRRILFRDRAGEEIKLQAMDPGDFYPLRIPDLASNTRPRIVTEGYVRDVRIDEEERTLHFKLAEIPQGAGPYIVCEIMSPIRMTLPREGSRVRVYGVARYDGQPGREWHEVNPVLNIAVLKN
jgi:hypothetical protein